MFRSIIFLTSAVVFLAPVSWAQSGSKQLDLDLWLEYERASGPQLSPDGQEIVYSRSWVDKMNDRWESTLYLMNADGSKPRELVDGRAPVWSPDGTRIAYVADGEPKGSQIFVRWMDAEGAVTQVSRLTESPSGIAWSPDGSWIAFSMFVPETDRWRIKLPARPKGAKWTEDPRIVTSMQYRRDRRGFLEDGYRHIFVLPAEGGTPRQITSGEYNHRNAEWTPDGQWILTSGLRVEDAEYQWRESEIYAFNVESGAVRQLTSRRGPDGSPTVSPSGNLIAYTGNDWTDDTYTERKLYVMNGDGGGVREIARDLDRSPAGMWWADDERGVFFNVNDQGTRNLYFAPLSGPVRQVTQGNHMLTVSSIQGAHATGVMSSYHKPPDVVTVDVGTGETNQVTFVNDDILAGRTLGKVEHIRYSSVEGFDIDGWIIKPPDFDPSKQYPLMLYIHGGPHGMYNVGFNFEWQNHAANGYVVLYTNPRGSSGYGSEFGNAIKRAYPGKDFDDLMNGVDAVIEQGYIDTRNMFVTGCSGGGVLTSWVVGHTERFAGAAANCPVTNWLSFVGTTDGPGWYRNFDELPWNDPSEHLRRSPLMYVGNVTTPTMLMTGVRDLRTPMGQTEEYYMALKMERVETAMIRVPGEWHGVSSVPSNFLRKALYLRSWFERFTTKDDRQEVAATSEGSIE